MRATSAITMRRPEEPDESLRRAWHRARDEPPEHANPFLTPEFTPGAGRCRGEARAAVLHHGGEADGFFPYARAARSGPRARTMSAAWCTAHDPAFGSCSPGLTMHLRLAQAAGRDGVTLMDLGRGGMECEDWRKTPELREAEGFATRPHPVAAAHGLWRRPVRGPRNTVLAHPGPRGLAAGSLRTSLPAHSPGAGTRAR